MKVYEGLQHSIFVPLKGSAFGRKPQADQLAYLPLMHVGMLSSLLMEAST